MSEARQRWRLVFGRDEEARYLAHLDAVKLWERAFRRGSIPIATTEGFSPRPRLIFAAPLPLGMLAEHELADLFLDERLTLPNLRERLLHSLPRGYGLVDLYDEWIGAPSLASLLVAADYRLTVLGLSRDEVERAIGSLMAAERLDREKRRETKAVAYDLRPLLIELRACEAAPESGMPAAGLWMRLRHSQDLGSGRAEEVVAALAEELEPGAPGRAPETVAPVRERLWLAAELEGDAAASGA